MIFSRLRFFCGTFLRMCLFIYMCVCVGLLWPIRKYIKVWYVGRLELHTHAHIILGYREWKTVVRKGSVEQSKAMYVFSCMYESCWWGMPLCMCMHCEKLDHLAQLVYKCVRCTINVYIGWYFLNALSRLKVQQLPLKPSYGKLILY